VHLRLYGIVRQSFTREKAMTTLENIQAKISKLQAQAEAIVRQQKWGVLETIRGLMEKHAVTIEEIEAHAGAKRGGPKAGVKVAVKQTAVAAQYRDPQSGSTWSGRGRAPAWIASVKDRSRFLIDTTSLDAASGKPVAVTVKSVRAPQPAQYLDAKTGATWSGRGRAPAWIAKAKDRTKFLIAAEGQSAERKEGAASAEKATPAKKAVNKRHPVAKKAARARSAAGARAQTAKKAPGRKGRARSEPIEVAVPGEASEQNRDGNGAALA
jgi:DNA-binding protein H-NS